MLALTLDQAKLIALVILAGLAACGMIAAWVMKTIVQKLIVVAVVGVAALGVWSQRSAVEECADEVRSGVSTSSRGIDATCTFFGRQVTVSAGASAPDRP